MLDVALIQPPLSTSHGPMACYCRRTCHLFLWSLLGHNVQHASLRGLHQRFTSSYDHYGKIVRSMYLMFFPLLRVAEPRLKGGWNRRGDKLGVRYKKVPG